MNDIQQNKEQLILLIGQSHLKMMDIRAVITNTYMRDLSYESEFQELSKLMKLIKEIDIIIGQSSHTGLFDSSLLYSMISEFIYESMTTYKHLMTRSKTKKIGKALKNITHRMILESHEIFWRKNNLE